MKSRSIAIGILSNTVLKLLLGLFLGRARFRILASAWLTILAIATATSIVVLR